MLKDVAVKGGDDETLAKDYAMRRRTTAEPWLQALLRVGLRHGLRERRGWERVNAIYTMTTIVSLSSRAKCLRAAAKGREEEGEGRVVTTHTAGDRRFRSRARAREHAGVAEGKQGMFVVRVIWPIKPRGGARSTPASPFADR